MLKKGLFILVILFALTLAGCDLFKTTKVISVDEAKAKAEDYINKNLVAQGTTITITDVKVENGLYKLTVKFNSGKTTDSYLTMDGSKFFTEGYDLSKPLSTDGSTAPTEVPKSDKPIVELFVMSHCPYGTQIEKGIIPVVETLKDKISFDLKFCDYAMHGQKEVDEELNQYCIKTNQADKLIPYLKCFLADETKSQECRQQVGINEANLKTCISKTDSQYKITEKFNDKSVWISGQFPPFDIFKDDNTKYGIQGSPSLVINGTTASAGRDSASLLTLICSAFNTPPAECGTVLSATAPSAGFGYGEGDPNSAASCGTQ